MKVKDLLVQQIVEGLQEKKAKKIVVADMTNIEEAAFQYFVICEGNSTTQVNSIAEGMMDYVRKEANHKPFAYDGFQNRQWIAVDYGYVLVHVFLPEYREFYKLEQLWADAQLTEIPDLD
ncbi:MAG: ribosome silencing factor [Bacteroidales bacterium]